MATELLEYRPGRWVKVIDGKIVGRATAKEVAAWQAGREETEVPSAPLTLEVDLDLPASSSAIDPGHSLDVPLRPAYSRRGRKVEPPKPARAGRPEPRPAGKPDEAIDKDMTLEAAISGDRVRRAGPKPQPARRPGEALDKDVTAQGAGPPDDAIDKDMTLEMAMARERAAQRRSARPRPKPQAAGGPTMVRRRLPKAEAAPAEKPQEEPPTEDTPLPKQSKPAKTTQRKPSRRRKAPAAAAAKEAAEGQEKAGRKPAASGARKKAGAKRTTAESRKKAARKPATAEGRKKAGAKPAAPEQPQEAAGPPASQGPSYWWIYNANRRPAAAFLEEWMPKYQEKFGHEATVVLCHEDDVGAVEAGGVEAEVSELLQPGHFYLGHEDGSGPEAGGKKKR